MARALQRRSPLALPDEIRVSARRGFEGLIDFAISVVEIAAVIGRMGYRAALDARGMRGLLPGAHRRSRRHVHSRPRARVTEASDKLEVLTRAQLYEEAQRLGIPGRSSMSKAQLLKALTAPPAAQAATEVAS